jgi:hypothetical protein
MLIFPFKESLIFDVVLGESLEVRVRLVQNRTTNDTAVGESGLWSQNSADVPQIGEESVVGGVVEVVHT